MDVKNENFRLQSKFWKKLQKNYNVGVFSLNYDDLILQALPNLFTGFDKESGAFLDRKVLLEHKWNFYYQLHGSVHFNMESIRGEMHSIRWKKELNSPYNQNSSGRSSQDTQEGLHLPTSNIILGHEKITQIQRQPFRSYFCRLNQAILETDYIMFIGYGFRDLHINNCFKLLHNKKCPILIVSYKANEDNKDSIQFRNDDWTIGLFNTLQLNVSSPKWSVPETVNELKNRKECEILNDPKQPVAIWYNGFKELCENKNYQIVDDIFK